MPLCLKNISKKVTKNKKLSCRREDVQCFVSFENCVKLILVCMAVHNISLCKVSRGFCAFCHFAKESVCGHQLSLFTRCEDTQSL